MPIFCVWYLVLNDKKFAPRIPGLRPGDQGIGLRLPQPTPYGAFTNAPMKPGAYAPGYQNVRLRPPPSMPPCSAGSLTGFKLCPRLNTLRLRYRSAQGDASKIFNQHLPERGSCLDAYRFIAHYNTLFL